MNLCVLEGRCCKIPELRQSKTGKIFCTFRMVVDRPFRGKDKPRECDYFNCTCFGKTAQFVYKNLGKGALMSVHGRMESRKWESKSGESHVSFDVICQTVTIHEWLRNQRGDGEELGAFDTTIVPEGVKPSLFKQIEFFEDEDMPDDF